MLTRTSPTLWTLNRPGESAAPSLPSIAELTAFACMMEDAGLLVAVEDTDGRAAYLLTTDGLRLSRMLAMVDGHEADEVLDALLPRGSASRPGALGRSIETLTLSVTLRS